MDPKQRCTCSSCDFTHAVECGNVEAVRLLIFRGINPSACDNQAIRLASKMGHIGVVRLLLNDERVNPRDCDNWPIRWASKNGHSEIVWILLDDRRVDPSPNNLEVPITNPPNELIERIRRERKMEKYRVRELLRNETGVCDDAIGIIVGYL